MKALLTKILTAVLVLAFLFSGWQIYRIQSAYAEAREQYSELEQYVSAAHPADTEPEHFFGEDESGETDLLKSAVESPSVDFGKLRDINPEVVGWLILDGTRVSYPIVHGEDNDFYLKRQFDGGYSSAGCPFLDAGSLSDFSLENNIVYGHYRQDKSMFHDVTRYKKQDYFDEHPRGWLITPTEVYRLRVFSGYVTATDADAWKNDFSGDEYEQWLEKIVGKSAFSSKIVPGKNDRVLTLSTCSYEFYGARFVLHCIMDEQVTYESEMIK